MEVKNTIFELLLTKSNFKKKDFAEYSKIPYDTVVGWKKKDKVPAYAMVILKDMIYRKKVDDDLIENLNRNHISINNYNLTKYEEKRLSSAFWGTNLTIDEIIKQIKEKNQKILKKVEENLPKDLIKQILGKINYA
ncbi:hypothetical protein [Aliarcobacter vitoriensis]|uniref:Uncharacterized protein n=1 Tax=Aliarcobacter vitoriensis TaxID=2011099 RepID=A0A366MWK8_9BACT|nr:hypothetical protein [Aliarcobacter vitoriensis]RBQ29984.1 hypothetical protein CRU91_01510 [Aliarcobacter vitoriensis]